LSGFWATTTKETKRPRDRERGWASKGTVCDDRAERGSQASHHHLSKGQRGTGGYKSVQVESESPAVNQRREACRRPGSG
jgi:hypothetical protein